MSLLREFRRGLEAARPLYVEPCLPTPAKVPPQGPGWLAEIKHDGFRLMIRRDTAGVRLITRGRYEWSARYPTIAAAAGSLRCSSCLIDGEVVVAGQNGVADFGALRHGPQIKPHAFLYAFDLIALDGADLRRRPIEDRKAALAKLLHSASAGIQLNEHIETDAGELFAHACRMGLEGIVWKRAGSAYKSGRSRDWIKLKNPNAPAVKRGSGGGVAAMDPNGRLALRDPVPPNTDVPRS